VYNIIMFLFSKKHINYVRGFTLVELMISITIFVIMSALLVAKYGTFNQSVLFTNLAYDIALTLRTAQTYGLSVRNTESAGSDPLFQYPYGVAFCAKAGGCGNGFDNTNMILYADFNVNGRYDGEPTDKIVSTYYIKRGASIRSICSIENCDPSAYKDFLAISFIRPYPDAIICFESGSRTCIDDGQANIRISPLAEIMLQSSDGSLRAIYVRRSGQISVGK
jgi:prepilin-type N-terminal cleavage/methylation domain-containing protein